MLFNNCRKLYLLYLNKINKFLNVRNLVQTSLRMQVLDPEQEKLLSEKCILVNNKDKFIGSATKEECHLQGENGSPPPLHRAFSVFLFNNREELLLQQRSQFKITFPNYITNTCCSHPLSNEEEMIETDAKGVKLAAKRRICFELGIPDHEIQTSDFKYLTRIHYASPSLGSKWGEHEIDYILIIKKDVTMNINPNEVKQVIYIKESEFANYIESLVKQNITITPWFRLISERFLPLWWKNLDKLDKFVDHDTIHFMK